MAICQCLCVRMIINMHWTPHADSLSNSIHTISTGVVAKRSHVVKHDITTTYRLLSADCSISSALAMEILQSWAKPTIYQTFDISRGRGVNRWEYSHRRRILSRRRRLSLLQLSKRPRSPWWCDATGKATRIVVTLYNPLKLDISINSQSNHWWHWVSQ